MHRSQGGELAKLHDDLLRCRRAVEEARGAIIEALGDFMCGSAIPPGLDAIRELNRLCEALEDAEAAFAHRLAASAQNEPKAVPSTITATSASSAPTMPTITMSK